MYLGIQFKKNNWKQIDFLKRAIIVRSNGMYDNKIQYAAISMESVKHEEVREILSVQYQNKDYKNTDNFHYNSINHLFCVS